MQTVINESKKGNHTVDKYRFKVFSMGGQAEEKEHTVSYAEQQLDTPPVADSIDDEPLPGHKPMPHRDELVESLLKKTDDVTSNFIKMQMKLEDMETAHKATLEQVRNEAYEEGIAAGRKAFENELNEAQGKGVSQFAESVKTLETKAQSFDEALSGIKEELIHAAIDIAKEVIVVETSEHGSEIAKKLSQRLIEELQSASKITLKVNPADHGAVSEKVGALAHVNVISDSAISRGGVVAVSDAGNIDSEIIKRFERIKQAALTE